MAGHGTRRRMIAAGAGGIVAGGLATLLLTGAADPRPVAPADRVAIEAVVRDYILAHPEIIPEAMQRLSERDGVARIERDRDAVERPFGGAWAGAARPDVTLVMFTDYACGYCRKSVADVDRLLAEDPKLRVVWRELPILGPGSEAAARMALAVAVQAHPRYLAFHRAVFAAGPPDEAKLTRAAAAAGVDAAALDGFARGKDVQGEIDANLSLAARLGVDGTPAFVVGKRMLSGAVGYEALKQAVAEARSAGS